MKHTRTLRKVGAAIYGWRKASGWTQARLAAAVGLTRCSITNIESGAQEMTVSGLAKIARALDVTLSELLEDVR